MNREIYTLINTKQILNNDNIIAITNRHLSSRPFMEQLERVCKLHPHSIVLREKDMPESEYLSLACDVISLCKEYNVQCILHSFVNVAVKLNHPYIHLPLPILEECAAIPCQHLMPDVVSTQSYKNAADYQQFFKVIGTSVHSVGDAIKAEQLGATYMTAGHIYATDCKKGLPPRGLDFLENVCDAIRIPVYAIGGINIASSERDNSTLSVPRLAEVMECGAAGVCIMSGMMKI